MLISNKFIQLKKIYLNYHKLIILKKEDQKEHFKVKGKVIEEKRNYCKVIIMSNQDKEHILQKAEIRNILKIALNMLNLNKVFKIKNSFFYRGGDLRGTDTNTCLVFFSPH